ncbi:MAG: FGGY-family carbohydrate kinase [Alphaproteobacteria bacterium]
MPEEEALFIGVDFGTSGVRVSIIDKREVEQAHAKTAFASLGSNGRDPHIWWRAFELTLDNALGQIDPSRVAGLAIDGTSGTLLAVNPDGVPLADALMYNDPCTDQDLLKRIAQLAPQTSAVHGASSGLARALRLAQDHDAHKILHQADWISFRLSGHFVSDENNALKTGYDPVDRCWPAWVADAGLPVSLLPDVLPAGTPVGPISEDLAVRFSLPISCQIVTGTTDGCASFLATGALGVGDGVTALGTTLTLKILSDKPIFAPQYGVYSHRLGDQWLAGGASNTGGNVLLGFFTPQQIAVLSAEIAPDVPTDLDYYPLSKAGERFPISDPSLAPKLTPRPESDVAFLQGMLEGMSAIEALGFSRLTELGGPALRSLRSVGGGAQNIVWSRIRQRRLGVPFLAAKSLEAAFGTALLAKRGADGIS